MDSDERVMQFIGASFPSVWALELLLILKAERRFWTAPDLVEALRASALVVDNALKALIAAGLVSAEKNGAIYLPINREIEVMVDQAEDLYRLRPNSVRRTIVGGVSRAASAFSDAFRIRGLGNE